MKRYLAWTNSDEACPLVGEIAPLPSNYFAQSLTDCGTSLGATTSPFPISAAAVGLSSLPDYILAAAFASHSHLLAPPTSESNNCSSLLTTPCFGESPSQLTARQLLTATSGEVNHSAGGKSGKGDEVAAAVAHQLHNHQHRHQHHHNPHPVSVARVGQQQSQTTHDEATGAGLCGVRLSNSTSSSAPGTSGHCAIPHSSSSSSVAGTGLLVATSPLCAAGANTPSFVHPSAFSIVNSLPFSSNNTHHKHTPTTTLGGHGPASSSSSASGTASADSLTAHQKALLEQVVQQPARPHPIVHSPATNQQVASVHSQQMSAAAAAAALYQQLMCTPTIFDRLGPHILRSHMTSAQFKPIPNNERVDLARFRAKEPQDWSMEDVIAWMLDVAKRNHIPFEDLEMHKFASCTGPLLLLMTEHNFNDRDPKYGSLLFAEFHKLVTDESFIDDWMRAYKESEEDPQPSTSRVFDPARLSTYSLSSNNRAPSPSSLLLSQQQPSTSGSQRNLPSPIPSRSGSIVHHGAKSTNSDFDSPGCSEDAALRGVSSKIKKNKDGKPRKRSQHTKGNKLWEFIRDALKDPLTCPSVVRWEDPIEGVFRIVESEKLARLWGDKKNNQKMTYEKLSRAMRTYYEKQILVPVPKTGLYPKKLVYKFGPSAHGWGSQRTVKLENCS